jgi:hypothetical protein
VAIATRKLHRPAGACQVRFQMYPVIEFDCAGINASSAHSGEFWMARIESVNISRIVRD